MKAKKLKMQILRTIDLTPTWEGILPIYLRVLMQGTTEGKTIACDELLRMARLADKYVASQKKA